MELPVIHLPQIPLPVEIPLLMHPIAIHFLVAIPVIVLLLEIGNLVVKKRAIGVSNFFLLLLMVGFAVAGYLTGSVDGKEAFPALGEMAKEELVEHKLLGTYLMLGSVVVLFFKMLSALIGRGLMKGLYLFILILFVALLFKQGKDGGELVYKYGINVEKVQELDSDLYDAKEELTSLQEEQAQAKKATPAPAVEVTPKTVPQKEIVESVVKPALEKVEKLVPAVVTPSLPAVEQNMTDEASVSEANTTL